MLTVVCKLSVALEENAPSQHDWSTSFSLIAAVSCERLTFHAIIPSCCCLLFQCPISEKLVPNRVAIGCFQSRTFTLLHPRLNPPSSAWTSHWCGRNMKWRETFGDAPSRPVCIKYSLVMYGWQPQGLTPSRSPQGDKPRPVYEAAGSNSILER